MDLSNILSNLSVVSTYKSMVHKWIINIKESTLWLIRNQTGNNRSFGCLFFSLPFSLLMLKLPTNIFSWKLIYWLIVCSKWHWLKHKQGWKTMLGDWTRALSRVVQVMLFMLFYLHLFVSFLSTYGPRYPEDEDCCWFLHLSCQYWIFWG